MEEIFLEKDTSQKPDSPDFSNIFRLAAAGIHDLLVEKNGDRPVLDESLLKFKQLALGQVLPVEESQSLPDWPTTDLLVPSEVVAKTDGSAVHGRQDLKKATFKKPNKSLVADQPTLKRDLWRLIGLGYNKKSNLGELPEREQTALNHFLPKVDDCLGATRKVLENNLDKDKQQRCQSGFLLFSRIYAEKRVLFANGLMTPKDFTENIAQAIKNFLSDLTDENTAESFSYVVRPIKILAKDFFTLFLDIKIAVAKHFFLNICIFWQEIDVFFNGLGEFLKEFFPDKDEFKRQAAIFLNDVLAENFYNSLFGSAHILKEKFYQIYNQVSYAMEQKMIAEHRLETVLPHELADFKKSSEAPVVGKSTAPKLTAKIVDQPKTAPLSKKPDRRWDYIDKKMRREVIVEAAGKIKKGGQYSSLWKESELFDWIQEQEKASWPKMRQSKLVIVRKAKPMTSDPSAQPLTVKFQETKPSEVVAKSMIDSEQIFEQMRINSEPPEIQKWRQEERARAVVEQNKTSGPESVSPISETDKPEATNSMPAVNRLELIKQAGERAKKGAAQEKLTPDEPSKPDFKPKEIVLPGNDINEKIRELCQSFYNKVLAAPSGTIDVRSLLNETLFFCIESNSSGKSFFKEGAVRTIMSFFAREDLAAVDLHDDFLVQIVSFLSPSFRPAFEKEIGRFYEKQFQLSFEDQFMPLKTIEEDKQIREIPFLLRAEERIEQLLPVSFYSTERTQGYLKDLFDRQIDFPMPRNNQAGKPIIIEGGNIPEHLYFRLLPKLKEDKAKVRAGIKLISVYLRPLLDKNFSYANMEQAVQFVSSFGLATKIFSELHDLNPEAFWPLRQNSTLKNLSLDYLFCLAVGKAPLLKGCADDLESARGINKIFRFQENELYLEMIKMVLTDKMFSGQQDFFNSLFEGRLG